MASIRSYETKDGEQRWMIDYYVPKDIAGTKRPKKVVKRGFKTLKAAKAALRERENWLEDGTHQQKAKKRRYTFDDLVKQYKEIFESQPSWKEAKKYQVERLARDFEERLLQSITYLELQKYRVKLQKTRIKRKIKRGKREIVKEYGLPTDATVNRYMSCLRHMLTCAVEWEMLTVNPFEGKKSLQQKEKKRERYLNQEEIGRFLKHCKVQHVRDFFVIAVKTGMDRGELLSLKWEQFKEGQIYCPEVKTRPERHIPISGDLDHYLNYLNQIRSRKIVSKYVVTDEKGRKLKDIKRSFKTTLRSAKIHNFRIKDLRHTFASHFIMRTSDLKTLQEILGHTNIKTTMRYAHLSKAHKVKQMQQMNGLTSKSRTDVELFAVSDHKKGLNENR
jgi:integrase